MYGMFFTQFGIEGGIDGGNDGKIDGNPVDNQENFAIRRSNAKKVEGVMWPLFSIGALIWVFFRQTIPASIYEIIFFSAAVVVSSWYMIHCLRWKITGLESSFKIRSAFGDEKEYCFSDITKVELEQRKIKIFTDENKSVKIPSGASCSALIDKFQSENIPLYRDGEMM
jgi:hypothetical protein